MSDARISAPLKHFGQYRAHPFFNRNFYKPSFRDFPHTRRVSSMSSGRSSRYGVCRRRFLQVRHQDLLGRVVCRERGEFFFSSLKRMTRKRRASFSGSLMSCSGGRLMRVQGRSRGRRSVSARACPQRSVVSIFLTRGSSSSSLRFFLAPPRLVPAHRQQVAFSFARIDVIVVGVKRHAFFFVLKRL